MIQFGSSLRAWLPGEGNEEARGGGSPAREEVGALWLECICMVWALDDTLESD